MSTAGPIRSWLRCYRCWSQDLEVQVHYEGIHRIDPITGKRADVVDELQEAVVQCLDCMHDQPHLVFHNDRIEPVEDRWERMVVGTPWVASCTVTVDAESVETCSGPEAADALAYAAFGDHGTREFFTHVRFHKHEEDQIVVHLLVELYARSSEEATGCSRRPPAASSRSPHWPRSRARPPRPAATPALRRQDIPSAPPDHPTFRALIPSVQQVQGSKRSIGITRVRGSVTVNAPTSSSRS